MGTRPLTILLWPWRYRNRHAARPGAAPGAAVSDEPFDVNYQAEVMRRSQYSARARSPPRRNYGDVVVLDEREQRAEEDFTWVGSSAATPSTQSPMALAYILAGLGNREDLNVHRSLETSEIRPSGAGGSEEAARVPSGSLGVNPVHSKSLGRFLCCC